MVARLVCGKCGREKPETEFFKTKQGNRYELCKACLTQHIDNYNPETFIWILKDFDVPYIKEVWDQQCQRILAKVGPAKFGPASVLGQYIRIMNMAQYKMYTYEDSDKLNEANEKKRQEEAARREQNKTTQKLYMEELFEKKEKGEISEAEFKSRNILDVDEELQEQDLLSKNDPSLISEQEILKDLTAEDQKYLLAKWGAYYKPSEWLQMERMYNSYADEYELNIDRAETLKKICKVSLKMDQAIDAGDINGSKNYGSVLDTLRKSAKFTEAQNKEQQVRELDSIGELVRICECEGGIIEQFPTDPDEYPQDKIDFTIKDLKAYNYNLVVNELGLGDLIESYIEKLEKRQEEEDQELNDLVISREQEEEEILTEEEALEFQNYLMNEIENDAEQFLKEAGQEETENES